MCERIRLNGKNIVEVHTGVLEDFTEKLACVWILFDCYIERSLFNNFLIGVYRLNVTVRSMILY